jgi:hypothetical protein
MVDVSLLQSASYVAAAIGVCVAAFYYALNLRETTRNRRSTLSMNIMQSFLAEEGTLRFMDLLNMQWSDFEDFKRKYDSSVNPENYAKRAAFWNTCEVIGYQYRAGILDIKTIYNVGGFWIWIVWRKFKSVIEENRKWEYTNDRYENFEFLANLLHKMQLERDAESDKKVDILISTQLKHSIQ